MRRAACYGNSLTLQWARTTGRAAEEALAELRSFGAPVEVRAAPGLPGRWRVMRDAHRGRQPRASLLDVGGFGEYKRHGAPRRGASTSTRTGGCDVYAAGTSPAVPLKLVASSTALLETVLHHAAEDALQLLGRGRRASRASDT